MCSVEVCANQGELVKLSKRSLMNYLIVKELHMYIEPEKNPVGESRCQLLFDVHSNINFND